MSENRLFDKRCVQHYISTGALRSEAFAQYLEALPDLQEKACPIEARLEGEESKEALVPAEDVVPAENPEPHLPEGSPAEMP